MSDYETDVQALEAKAAIVGVILEDGGVFGHKDEWSAQERHHFIGMVLRHALDPLTFAPLTIPYRTGVSVTLNTRDIQGHAEFSGINVAQYQTTGFSIDCADLQQQILEALQAPY